MVGWSANAPSGSINCSAGDAAPARRWRGRYGAAVFIWIAGRRAEKDPAGERAGWQAFRPRVAQHPELGGYGLWLRQPGGGETRLTLPLGESISVNLQNMLASDGSWSSVGSISATLPGASVQCGSTGENPHWRSVRRSDADNRAIGGTLNLNALWSKLGTFSVSYNDDRRYNSHYYTADYYQTVYSGAFGSLGLRARDPAL